VYGVAPVPKLEVCLGEENKDLGCLVGCVGLLPETVRGFEICERGLRVPRTELERSSRLHGGGPESGRRAEARRLLELGRRTLRGREIAGGEGDLDPSST
jgi:hypothetical protein